MSSTFELRVTLDSPISIGRTYLTLDAVMFGILSELKEIGSSVDPIGDIPIARTGDLFLASRAYFHSPLENQEIKIGGIRPVRDMADANTFLQPARGRKLAKVRTSSGHTKANLSRYQTISCESVYWIAQGDGDRCSALIQYAGSIGAMRKDGHGQVRDVTVETHCNDNVLLDENGFVTRPVPKDILHSLDMQTSSHSAIESWLPPYWDESSKAECFVPPNL